jgi:hypothetical protein
MQPEGCGPCVFQISSEPQASKIHTCLPLPLGGGGRGEGATGKHTYLSPTTCQGVCGAKQIHAANLGWIGNKKQILAFPSQFLVDR